MPRPWRVLAGCALALVAVAIWSGWLVITRLAVTSTLTAEDLAALRFGASALILLPVVWRRGLELDRFGWRGLALIVICAGAPYVLLASHGLALATAAEAGVLIPGTIPLFVALISAFTVRERVGRVARIGLGLIIAGIAVIVVPALLRAVGWQLAGYAICLVSAVMWAAYTIEARRAGVDALHATGIIMVVSGALFLPIYLLLPGQRLWEASPAEFWLQLIYQGPLTGIVALLVYTRAVAILGATRASSFTALLPLSAMLLAIPVVGERPDLRTAIGAVSAALGVLLATAFARR
ncbi:DMT family transporter [Dongia deserti]|uniref:DMT family transporter n=1 Tax=Dongia deserti TaxID=2268030 RepID=UPI0013C460B6|nr:DMT family transporter [Dongia deserti]